MINQQLSSRMSVQTLTEHNQRRAGAAGGLDLAGRRLHDRYERRAAYRYLGCDCIRMGLCRSPPPTDGHMGRTREPIGIAARGLLSRRCGASKVPRLSLKARPKSPGCRPIRTKDAGSENDNQWHIEIIPKLTRVAGFEWAAGFFFNPTPPKESARFLREWAGIIPRREGDTAIGLAVRRRAPSVVRGGVWPRRFSVLPANELAGR